MQSNGFRYILPMNRKGEYITLNELDGRIVVCKRTSNMFPIPSKTSVAEVRERLFKGHKLDNWFLKHFKKWESEFVKDNLDQYNKLINNI